MEDFAKMTFPYCTIADNFYESDCGSLPWARALFISWNLISMYIFVSLFVSLVFENFSYVYQRSSESTTLSREEIRHFKAAWAKFDPHGTGFIPREDFPRLLKHLSGKFDMRIFSGAFTVGEIVKDCTFVKGEEHDCPLGPMVKSIPKASDNGKEVWIDLGRLNRRVNRMPLREIRKKRVKLEEFCEDVMIGSDLKGISFSTCILTIAHYNMIDEWKSMKLDELLRRLVRKQLAIDLMRRRKVLDLINSWILQKRHQDRRNGVQRFSGLGAPAMDIPEIFIEDKEYSEPSTPADSPEVGPQTPMLSPPSTTELHSRNRNMLPRLDTSVATAGSPSERSPSFLSRLANLSSAFSPRHRSMDRDDGALSPHDAGWHSDNESTMSAHDMRSMIASLDASAWGESMRRSFASRSASPSSPNSPRSPHSAR
ncbi:calcium channel protein [Ascosphaera pollenicola]|nr:calcium channel protein [Ascosphaera pollenicola]